VEWGEGILDPGDFGSGTRWLVGRGGTDSWADWGCRDNLAYFVISVDRRKF
jgi:hypothetical protein